MANEDAYDGIDFSFDEVRQEIVSLTSLAEKFLDREATAAITQWVMHLENLRYGPAQAADWSLSMDVPLLTDISEGEFEPRGRKGGVDVVGRLTSIWTVRTSGTKPPHPSFRLFGKASARVSIEDLGGKELALWKHEVGDHTSPGCHFHLGVGQESEAGLFPKCLTVPRLPSILVTPMDALEFLLGELYQERWYQHVSRDRAEVNIWQRIQCKRMLNLLDWYAGEINRSDRGTAWNSLKHAKPPKGIFNRRRE